IDTLIRKIGYKGTKTVMNALKKDSSLQKNLSAAAHLIHGSSESRFTITYCTELLEKKEIENVGFKYYPYREMIKKYNPSNLQEGYNEVDGEEIFFISKPGSGLWAWRNKFI
ncbi:MAG: hypothetical protein N2053_06645, partial [Chitinispirillaceae bacterium]|nr:hypothetical protein [Chitinispirillaceae bacterium]